MTPDPRGSTTEVEQTSRVEVDPAATTDPPVEDGRGWVGLPVDGEPERVAPAGRLEPPAGPTSQAEPAVRKVRRGRRVKRVIRRIELWSVMKVSLVLYTCFYATIMGALVVIWGFAYSAGLVDNFESFANDVGFENWQFYGEHMFRQAAIIGGVLVVAGTVMTVLTTALVNVISELTGGIRVVVIEEDTIYLPVTDDK